MKTNLSSLPKLPELKSLTDADRTTLEKWFAGQQDAWRKAIEPPTDAFGLRHLPRDPVDPNRFLSTFKTDAHTYTIIGENGIGFPRYTLFQKRSIQRGFARDFQQIYDELQRLKMTIGGEQNIGKLRTDAIIHITGIQDSVADFGREQFEASLWLCTLFVLREDETVNTYSEQIAEEKIKDWAAYGFSELDFFLLSGSVVPGYGSAYSATMQRSERARTKYQDSMDVGVTSGFLSEESES